MKYYSAKHHINKKTYLLLFHKSDMALDMLLA